MTDSKPTIVIVGGGWHTPNSYSKLTSSLKSAGYEVHIPIYPSMNGARPPNSDLYTDTALVRGDVESLIDAGRTVIAIMHSYGGHVGTNALAGLGVKGRAEKGLPGGVSHLVYMCASAFPEGESMISLVQEMGHEHLMPLAFDFAEDQSCVCRDPKMTLIGEGVDDAEVETYLSTLVRWNGKCMYQEISQCAWRGIPVTYIYTTQDMTIPLDYQKSMVEMMRGEGQIVDTEELATGHCPNLTMPQGVVDAVDQIVKGKGN